MKQCYIYVIFNKNNIPIYVGRSVNPKQRFIQHKYDGKKHYFCDEYKCKPNCVNSYEDCYFSCHFDILETTDIKNSYWLEKYWIEQMRQWGFELINDQFNLCRTKLHYMKPSKFNYVFKQFNK